MTEPDFITNTRASYDAMAADYARAFPDEFGGQILDRAVLAAFTELVRTEGPASWGAVPAGSVASAASVPTASAGVAPVADIGCGPGHVTAHLSALGVPAFGVDLSPAMVALAREAHPELRFAVGSMTAMDLPDGVLGGVAAVYSTIHVPDDELPAVFREFHRVLAPGGHVLLVFQTGDERARLTERFGRAISLDCHWRDPGVVAGVLEGAELSVRARVERAPYEDEKLPRAFLLARRPPAPVAG
ncbi:class I SAM-dependent methyltransferase [Streptomyces sp. NBC_00414]|uniref:class I SAM-dependent methyltransferase n=1 Tax=Streptomyces sp. NBC_00414 TaxID=2975739 RepID=UPI002E1D8C3D